MRELRMLAACEMSGRVRDAFAKRGWEAWSADLLPSETPCRVFRAGDDEDCFSWDRPFRGSHYQGDCRDLFRWDHPVNRGRERDAEADPNGIPMWDLVIAFPPCTDLSLAGARYWKAKRADGRQQAAAAFFMDMANAPAPRVAVENPVGYMGKTDVFRRPDQVVEPWWFGDPLRKKTCLWLENLPLLTADCRVEPLGRVATGGGSWRTDMRARRGVPQAHEDSEGRARRNIVRSRTLPGFARATAGQWGSFIEESA